LERTGSITSGVGSATGDLQLAADGGGVGSAIVRLIGELGESADAPKRVSTFVKSLVDATNGR
jgi:tryptophan synthase alpha subunit